MRGVEEVSCEGVMPAFITSTQMSNRTRNNKQLIFLHMSMRVTKTSDLSVYHLFDSH